MTLNGTNMGPSKKIAPSWAKKMYPEIQTKNLEKRSNLLKMAPTWLKIALPKKNYPIMALNNNKKKYQKWPQHGQNCLK